MDLHLISDSMWVKNKSDHARTNATGERSRRERTEKKQLGVGMQNSPTVVFVQCNVLLGFFHFLGKFVLLQNHFSKLSSDVMDLKYKFVNTFQWAAVFLFFSTFLSFTIIHYWGCQITWIFSRMSCLLKRSSHELLSWASAGGGETAFPFPGNWTKNQKCLEKLKSASSFTGMALTLHKSQLHCSDAIQWWVWSSLMSTPSSADSNVTKLASTLF